MKIGVLDLFRIGIGPSSSHTVGPMRAARRFVLDLAEAGVVHDVTSLDVELFGSLAATGVGHGTVSAVVLGLAGFEPHLIDPDEIAPFLATVEERGELSLLGRQPIVFRITEHVVLLADQLLPGHPNGMRFRATCRDGAERTAVFYSVGGGFIASAAEIDEPLERGETTALPYPFGTADELLEICNSRSLTIADVVAANERARRPDTDVDAELLGIWRAMCDCVDRGCRADGVLPGGLGVKRRAAAMHRSLTARVGSPDPLSALDWVNLWALAVNEENAAGGRVVTAPTNGAAGIVPAVLHYYWHFVPGADERGVVSFLLAAGAVGALFKMNASISGAEVGCQGEVGSACAMAAAGLAQVMGGSPDQVENAAEIGLEHNLGLTCDPIGGLVQVPCIERNAMAATKAINAARLALHGDGTHLVSLDQAIETLRATGRDMLDSYKETARGGLAVTFRSAAARSGLGDLAPVPVSVVEC